MLRRLIFLVAFLVIFGTFAFAAIKFEDEKSNVYYMKDGEQYSLVAINTDKLYLYGVELEDNLTLSNGTNYTSFANIKSDPNEAISYLEYTFSVEEIRYLDMENPDYGSEFANYLVSETTGNLDEFANSLTDLPHSYESKYNVEYLRLAKLANYNSNGYMDKDILTSVVNGEDDGDVNTVSEPITNEMIVEVFYDINEVEVICNEQEICTYDETEITPITKEMAKLVNDKVTYITNYDNQVAK